jgi:hypothetical protein
MADKNLVYAALELVAKAVKITLHRMPYFS